MSSSLHLLGRLLLAAIFLVSGVRKALAFQATVATLAGKGFPYAEIVAILTIALKVGGGLMLLTDIGARPAGWALAAFTLAAGVLFHAFWLSPPDQWIAQFNNFMKNIAIVGGLIIAAETATARRRADT